LRARDTPVRAISTPHGPPRRRRKKNDFARSSMRHCSSSEQLLRPLPNVACISSQALRRCPMNAVVRPMSWRNPCACCPSTHRLRSCRSVNEYCDLRLRRSPGSQRWFFADAQAPSDRLRGQTSEGDNRERHRRARHPAPSLLRLGPYTCSPCQRTTRHQMSSSGVRLIAGRAGL
jgi:hypothetical protein